MVRLESHFAEIIWYWDTPDLQDTASDGDVRNDWARSPVVFLHVGIEVGKVGDAKACHGLADVLLGGRVDEALACTEAEVAGVTEVVLQGLAQSIGLVYGEAREHLHEAAGIAHLRGRMEHGTIALCGGEVGGVDDGDGLLVGRQHL